MAGTRVYLGGLPMGCKERDLEDFVNAYGRTRDILLKEGFAFIEFEDYRDADDAVYELNGRELLGERVTVEHARPSRGGEGGGGGGGRGSSRGGGGGRGFSRGGGRGFFRGGGRDQGRQSSNRLVVENLSSQVSWQDLKDYMRQAGDVAFADAHKLRKNEGVVEFTSYSALKIALDTLDGTELDGRRIRLREERKRYRGSRSSSIN